MKKNILVILLLISNTIFAQLAQKYSNEGLQASLNEDYETAIIKMDLALKEHKKEKLFPANYYTHFDGFCIYTKGYSQFMIGSKLDNKDLKDKGFKNMQLGYDLGYFEEEDILKFYMNENNWDKFFIKNDYKQFLKNNIDFYGCDIKKYNQNHQLLLTSGGHFMLTGGSHIYFKNTSNNSDNYNYGSIKYYEEFTDNYLCENQYGKVRIYKDLSKVIFYDTNGDYYVYEVTIKLNKNQK